MMITAVAMMIAAMASLLFATLTYALRDFSRSRLEDSLRAQGREQWLERIVEHRHDLIFVTATGRLLANIVIVIGAIHVFSGQGLPIWAEYLCSLAVAGTISLILSVAIPTALANYVGEAAIAFFARLLHATRLVLSPLTAIMRWIDRIIQRLTGATAEPEPEQIEKDILSAVEEGEKEGVVDTQEREMIESVIEFRDTQAGQIMTARPEVVALEVGAALEEIRHTIEESGHSRIPIYDSTLDHIVGVLYARDLLKHLGCSPAEFDIRSAMRPPLFVPETKPLRDLLMDFRMQKIHIAIVLDEYGGTAGLVTIEDVLEELVGEISDEHEPQEPAMLKRLNDTAYEADARLHLDEVNREMGLNLPEDAGYDTLGGFVLASLGQIPQRGTVFEQQGARFTVLDAEPQRVKRLKVELLPQVVERER